MLLPSPHGPSQVGSSVLSSADAPKTRSGVQEAIAAPSWPSQAGSSVLSSADASKTRPPLYKRPVLLPAGLLKLGALSSLLLMLKDASSVEQEASAAPHGPSQVGSSVLSFADASKTQLRCPRGHS